MAALTPYFVRRVLDRLSGHLREGIPKTAGELCAQLDDSGCAQVARLLDTLFPLVASEAANAALDSLLCEINAAAAKEHLVGIEAKITPAENVGASQRWVWFEAPAEAPPQNTPELTAISPERLVLDQQGVVLDDDADVVLITFNKYETTAVLKAFCPNGTPATETREGITYNPLGEHGGMRVVHVISEQGSTTLGGAQSRTGDAIGAWHPCAVIAVGIAFGMDSGKQRIGDVLVSTHVQNYELVRINRDGSDTLRGSKPDASPSLLNRFKAVDFRHQADLHHWPRLHFGTLLSGEKLVDGLDFLDRLRRFSPEAIGGEMEGNGVYVAAHKARVDWIIVKAICDWGDGNKHTNKTRHQKLAAAHAAQVVRTALALGPLFDGQAGPTRDTPRRPHAPCDITGIVKYAPKKKLIGRKEETGLIEGAWENALKGEQVRPHVVCFIALGGEGKSALVANWAVRFAEKHCPGCDACFAWSFYRQGTSEQSAASSDLFLNAALNFFGDGDMAKSARGPEEKGRRLAELVGQRRALLILDGLEPLQGQMPPTALTAAPIMDPGIRVLLQQLTTKSLGLCLVTSRYPIRDLKPYANNAWQKVLKKLSTPNGVALLRSLRVEGPQNKIEELVNDVHGHALTLTLLGTYLRDAYNGDVRQRDRITFTEADAEVSGGHAFRVIEAYERWLAGGDDQGRRALALLRLLGLFDRPASKDYLVALLADPPISGLTEALTGLTEPKLNSALSRLKHAKLLTREIDGTRRLVSIDAHPLVREYFAVQLSKRHPQEWQKAHARLFDYLAATTPELDEPELEHLQPLYQAVRHGCLAGRLQDAYTVLYVRIQRQRQAYSLKRRGLFSSDLGVITGFFDDASNQGLTQFSRGLTPADELTNQAKSHLWLRAGFCLRALGRLNDARQPIKAGLDLAKENGDWEGAAIGAGSLSQMELTLGNITGAMNSGKDSADYADQSQLVQERLAKRTIYAEALHQIGDLEEAKKQFSDAENLQAERQPSQPFLHSIWGFRYCQLLLAPAERAAWRAFLTRGRLPDVSVLSSTLEIAAAIAEVKRRATEWTQYRDSEHSTAAKTSPAHNLDEALERLAGGYALFLEAILTGSLCLLERCGEPLNQAVKSLRQAGQQDHLPRGLLPRAWWLFLSGRPAEAHADLDEAWEIADYGAMSLFKADILLTRARLFATRADLTNACLLIRQHGYRLREEELADAEAKLGSC